MVLLPYPEGKTLSQIISELDERITKLESQIFEKK